jgi:hypothetical protein
MPSDERITKVLEILRPSIERYRSAIAGTHAHMTDYLATHRDPSDGRAALAATALGQFAGGRLDASRFAAAFEGVRVLSPEDVSRIGKCIASLEAIRDAGDDAFICDVPSGGDFAGTIDAALANLGKAFGAALVFQAVRTQTFREAVHLSLLDAFPFDRWNRPERSIAPPLVVNVDGSDLEPGSVARLLDGRLQIVFVVRGTPAPAALVSLITPGVFVMQTGDASDAARMMTSRGPAVVSIVENTSARFVHDPLGGSRLADRLEIQSVPAEQPTRSIGKTSVSQQREQLAQLGALAAAARAELQVSATQAMDVAGAAAAAMSSRNADAVDTLAGWLLTNAGMAEQATQ